VTRVLDQAGYRAALRTKLLEEAREAQAAPDGQLASNGRWMGSSCCSGRRFRYRRHPTA